MKSAILVCPGFGLIPTSISKIFGSNLLCFRVPCEVHTVWQDNLDLTRSLHFALNLAKLGRQTKNNKRASKGEWQVCYASPFKAGQEHVRNVPRNVCVRFDLPSV